MRHILPYLLVLLLPGCDQKQNSREQRDIKSIHPYSTFNKKIHLRPLSDKTRFDTSHGFDFGWSLLEPINIATDQESSEIELSKRLSAGQKALYFFWHLDAEVTNGGFIQFYWNGYRKYIPPILEGLQLIGDTAMVNLIQKADREYLLHSDKFAGQKQKNDWTPLYEKLKDFERHDEHYYKIHDQTMELIEKYARRYPEQFVKFNQH
jgi:hypothetical protein